MGIVCFKENLLKGSILGILLLFITLSGCEQQIKTEDKTAQWLIEVHKRPAYKLKKYRFSSKTPVYDRIIEPESWVLDNLNIIDQRIYSGREPSIQEKAIISNLITLFPPLVQQVIQDRLMRIYIIDDFRGGALTDWIPDRNGDLYCIMVLNAGLFKKSMSEWLSMRDNMGLMLKSGDRVALEFDTQYPALLYILLHEAVHVVDHVVRINPFVGAAEYHYYRYFHKKTDWAPSEFSKTYWDGPTKMKEDYDFEGRKDITFYDFGKPSLGIDDAERMWALMEKRPFVSLYGASSWAEDLAEFVTVYHLQDKMGISYKVDIYTGGKKSSSYAPTQGEGTQQRKEYIEKVFYKRD